MEGIGAGIGKGVSLLLLRGLLVEGVHLFAAHPVLGVIIASVFVLGLVAALHFTSALDLDDRFIPIVRGLVIGLIVIILAAGAFMATSSSQPRMENPDSADHDLR